MDFQGLFDKAKGLVGGASEIKSLVDQLPEAIKSKVSPLIDKVTGGDNDALNKVLSILNQYKDNDIVKKLLAKLKK